MSLAFSPEAALKMLYNNDLVNDDNVVSVYRGLPVSSNGYVTSDNLEKYKRFLVNNR